MRFNVALPILAEEDALKSLADLRDFLWGPYCTTLLLVRTLAHDTQPEAEQVLIEGLRRASASRKFEMVVSANEMARTLALVGLRERHPGESESRLRRRLADLWLGPELARKAYGPLPEHE